MKALDRVIGYDSIKMEMYRILDVLNNPEKYGRMGVVTPKGILLAGKPGIGKTLLSKCFVEESGRKSYIVRKDKPDGEFVNYIKNVFEDASKNEPSIILLDDMDKYANEDDFHRDAEEYVTVQSCIDDVKDKQVFVIATVNDMSCLPDSLRRDGRFDKTFYMRFPRGKDAEKIIDYYLSTKTVDEDIDVTEIARFCEGSSCAELETVVNEAGIYAGFEGRKLISNDDLKRACIHKFYGISSDDEIIPDSRIEKRAIHEAGHLVIAELYEPGSVNLASIVSKNNPIAGGTVSVKHGADFGSSIEDQESIVMTALGGKAALEVVKGTVDFGSNRDVRKAFDSVREILDDNTAYDFNSWVHGKETSLNIYDHLDSATGVEVARYYQMTKKLLIDNRAFLDAVIKALMEKHTLSYKDIARIREEKNIR